MPLRIFGNRRKNRIRKRPDEIWRGEGEIRGNHEWISLYFRYRQSDDPALDTVDARTWDDLEMDQVFARIDRTVSVVGCQYLHAMLRIYKSDPSGLLITGSNMAGKTSFIKTVGINMILAQTIFIVLAERAGLPRRIVRSSIKREEQVLDGQSYYSREIELLREFLDCPENRCLFLVDEIFRGTNTVERVAISAATLRYLTRRNMALVTTHDVELQPLLADCARLFHFSEQVDGDRYYFDFILRDGPCRAGNAIRLIELKGYPAGLVSEARRLSKIL